MTRKKNPMQAELGRLLRQFPETETMELLVPDILGVLKGKRIRRKDFEKACNEPFWFCGGTVTLSALGEVLPGLPGAGDGDPDLPCRVVPGSLAPVPWADRPAAQGLFRIYGDDGKPYLADPRAVLEALMATREPLYREIADLTVDTDSRKVRDVVNEILDRL